MDGVQFAVYGEHLLKFRINQSSRSFRHQIVPIHSKQFLFKLSRPGSGADFIFSLSSNYVTIKTFTGLKILISLFCFGASFYQSFVLFDNFKSKDTLRKNTEVTYPDNYTTPMIIVCSDPGNQKPEDPLIELNNEADLSGLIPPVRVFRTMYKVLFEKLRNIAFCFFLI